MKKVNHKNCIKLYEVMEDVPQKDEDGNELSDDNLSEKLYMILEFARHKEIMSWSTDQLQFVSNPFIANQNGFASSENILRIL